MVINKNSENKKSLYLKYVKDIINSLESEPEIWQVLETVFSKHVKDTDLCF
jgi:hypothetical protein